MLQEKLKILQLIRGLEDREIQERVLVAGAALPEGEKLTLVQVVKMVEAVESAKSTWDLVTGAGGLNRLSNHRKGKQEKRQGSKPVKSGTGGGSGAACCKFCGRADHNRDSCLAKDGTCHNCGLKGHLSNRCRQK